MNLIAVSEAIGRVTSVVFSEHKRDKFYDLSEKRADSCVGTHVNRA